MRANATIGDEHPGRAVSQTNGSSEDEIDLFEMANLSREQTGVEGVIFISTRMARHAARVKWYPGRPKDKAPCLSMTIEPEPQAFNHHLATRVFEAASGPAKAWVALNQLELLDFWNNGHTWMDDEVAAFKRRLRKLT